MPDRAAGTTLPVRPATKRISEAQTRRNLATVYLINAQLTRIRLNQIKERWTRQVS